MALEAVVFQPDVFGYKDVYNLLGANWGSEDFGVVERDEEEKVRVDILESQTESCYFADWNWNSTVQSPIAAHVEAHTTPFSELDMTSPVLDQDLSQLDTSPTAVSMSSRPRRRRSKTRKNKEDIENQRMTHIAVERNRRKQMNEYLSVLRSLMPDSYVTRGDQASIIGGAINYVKELEQRLQYLGSNKHMTTNNGFEFEAGGSSSSSPFSDFFAFPQYTTGTTSGTCMVDFDDTTSSATTTTPSAMADIEVSMVETHAHLKIRSKRRPKQLVKMISGLQTLRLTILHLNVTTADQIVLYSLSVKVEDDCKLISVGEIATAVNQILGRIQEEALLI